MIALYTKYKESGLTRGEIIKKSPKPKPTDANLEPEVVAAFSERLDRLNAALTFEITKLRGVAYQKLKLLK